MMILIDIFVLFSLLISNQYPNKKPAFTAMERRCFVTFFLVDYLLLTKLLKAFEPAAKMKVTN
jgi:hypothetical protein